MVEFCSVGFYFYQFKKFVAFSLRGVMRNNDLESFVD